MSKKRKTAVLEHWFGIDRILFTRNPRGVLNSENFDKYCSTKGALLSNLYEIYVKIGYTPDKTFRNIKEMVGSATKFASAAKQKAKEILVKENVGNLIKEEIKDAGHLEGLSEKEVGRYIVMKRRNAVAIDAMTMGNALIENKELLGDWSGRVLIDAHKTLRDSLIDISLL